MSVLGFQANDWVRLKEFNDVGVYSDTFQWLSWRKDYTDKPARVIYATDTGVYVSCDGQEFQWPFRGVELLPYVRLVESRGHSYESRFLGLAGIITKYNSRSRIAWVHIGSRREDVRWPISGLKPKHLPITGDRVVDLTSGHEGVVDTFHDDETVTVPHLDNGGESRVGFDQVAVIHKPETWGKEVVREGRVDEVTLDHSESCNLGKMVFDPSDWQRDMKHNRPIPGNAKVTWSSTPLSDESPSRAGLDRDFVTIKESNPPSEDMSVYEPADMVEINPDTYLEAWNRVKEFDRIISMQFQNKEAISIREGENEYTLSKYEGETGEHRCPDCGLILPDGLQIMIAFGEASCPKCGWREGLCYLPKCRAEVTERYSLQKGTVRVCGCGHEQED